jgi:hypothetical protein
MPLNTLKTLTAISALGAVMALIMPPTGVAARVSSPTAKSAPALLNLLDDPKYGEMAREAVARDAKLRGTVDLATWSTRLATGLSTVEEQLAPGVTVRAEGTAGNFTLHWRLAPGVGPDAVRVRLPQSLKGTPAARLIAPESGAFKTAGKSGWSAPDAEGIVRWTGSTAKIGGGEITATAIVPFTAFSVTNTNDSGLGSLRQAILEANADTAGVPHVITVSATGTLTLLSELPSFSVPITINGPGADQFVVRPNTGVTTQIFQHFTAAGFSGMTIRDASASGGAGGILAFGSVTVNRCFITNNFVNGAGGGVNLIGGSHVITDSTISGNTSSSQGGGINNQANPLELINCTISGNSGSVAGGAGMFVGAFSPNQATTVTIRSCTFSGNAINGTPGPTTGKTLQLTTSTTGTITSTIGNSIFEGLAPQIGVVQTQPGTLSLTSVGGNVSSDNSGGLAAPADLVNTNPNLGPLTNNGGPMPTLALLPGSPAIDAGNSALVTNPPYAGPPFFDQRGAGFPRIFGGAVDAGAFEVQTSGTPVNANGSVSVTILTSALDVPTCGGQGYANDYVITGTLTNTSTVPLTNPAYVVAVLSETGGVPPAQPFRLISADGASCSSGGLVGARQSAGAPGFVLQPGQSVPFTFRIAVFQVRRFKFLFNVEAVTNQPTRAAANRAPSEKQNFGGTFAVPNPSASADGQMPNSTSLQAGNRQR